LGFRHFASAPSLSPKLVERVGRCAGYLVAWVVGCAAQFSVPLALA